VTPIKRAASRTESDSWPSVSTVVSAEPTNSARSFPWWNVGRVVSDPFVLVALRILLGISSGNSGATLL
jgi:hypothetical protein